MTVHGGSTEHGESDWARIEAIFLDALAAPVETREAFVVEACGGDKLLAAEVRALLAGAAHATTIDRGIDRAVGEVAGTEVGAVGDGVTPGGGAGARVRGGALQPDARVDRYRIVRELGRGGLSTVYLAERDDGDFEMQVALKVVRRGLDTDDIVERLRRERQILAHLAHPNIARLLDGGTTDDGLPFFVLEAIDGDHIDAYCEDRGLDVRSRLDLFAEVCDAVEHAHRSLVLHRDLKPSNIMVTAEGVPKLLDFGIAKLLVGGADETEAEAISDIPAAATLTEAGQRILTPQYASPEQIRGLPLTTASDVYSLGAVLYLLLAGRHPYDLRGKSLFEVERAVLEVEPKPPTSATASLPVDRELDAITLQALHKDPERRYATARDLSADVWRYLAGLPVEARGDSLRYRAEKYFRRNWLPILAALLVAISLATTVVVSTWQARIASAERTVAERERDRATRVRDFVVELFSWADPNTNRGTEVTARQLLDAGAVGLTRDLEEEPMLRSELLATVGDIYRRLSLYEKAEAQLRAAIEALEAVERPDLAALATRRTELAWVLLNQSRYEEAEALAVEAERSLDGLDVVDSSALERARVQIDRTLGTIARFEDRHDVAVERLERALARSRAVDGKDSLETAKVQADLGAALYVAGHPRQAEAAWTAALATRSAMQGDDHPESLVLWNDLAAVAMQDGRLEEAEERFAGLLERYRTIYGEDHVATATALYNLAQARAARAARDELPDLLESAIRDVELSVGINERVFGSEHTEVSRSLFLLALYRLQAGRTADAVQPARRAFEIRKELFGSKAHTTQNAAALVERIETAILEDGLDSSISPGRSL